MILVRIFTFLLLFAYATAVNAAEPDAYDPYELNLEQNINAPVVPSKSQQYVKDRMDKLKSEIEKQGFKASKLRHGEVILITIPCSEVFRANATTISPEGAEILKKLHLSADYESIIKVLIAVHSDNTGETEYSDDLTAERANAIDDFFSANKAFPGLTVVPYGLGRDIPVAANDSVKKRSQNRRIEIYFIPEENMYAKKKAAR